MSSMYCRAHQFRQGLKRVMGPLTACVVAAGALAAGCESTPAVCETEALSLQNSAAFAVGETYYLPRADPSCAGAGWAVEQAPTESRARVWEEGAPHPRFTPDMPGAYRFVRPGAPPVTVIAVQKGAKERFRNHYLTPFYGMARVGDELWVANGAAYTITRVRQRGGMWEKRDEIAVGSWPAAVAWAEGLPFGLVAHRGGDTVGFVDRERGVLEDALWVGDEPTGLVVSPDAKWAYVSLPNDREVAVVDLEARRVDARISTGFDPRAMTLSADGKQLFVASYRSRDAERDTKGTYVAEEDQDIWVIDTERREVVRTVYGLTSMLKDIALSEDGSELFVAATHSNPVVTQTSQDLPLPFVHEVIALDAATGEVRARADVGRQAGTGGPAVNLAGVLQVGDAIYVSADSSGAVVTLDAATLAERGRAEVGLGARRLVALPGGDVAVHSMAEFSLSVLSPEGALRQTVALTEDPRPAAVALGERVFLRTGSAFARHHGCSSCHVDAQNEGQVWRFGPNVFANVRPLQLLAATTPNGWNQYTSNAHNFGIQGPSSIIARPPTEDEAAGLAAFLGSLVGAPAANTHTRLDGSFTEAARRGKSFFEGKGGCAGCHGGPVYTSRRLIEVGKSGEEADVPTLLGVYRHGVFFVNGAARSLEQAVDVALDYVKVSASAEERADLLAFLQQLTVKSAAPLGIWPDLESAESVYPGVAPWAAFSEAVAGTSSSLSSVVRLESEAGAMVAGAVGVEGGRVSFRPSAELEAGRAYRFVVGKGLPFINGTKLEADRVSRFVVRAEPPAWALPQTLYLRVKLGGPMGLTNLDMRLDNVRVEGGAHRFDIVPLTFKTEQRQRGLWLRLDGERFVMGPFAIPISDYGVADAQQITGQLVRSGGEARIEGQLAITAPGRGFGATFTITAAPLP